MGYTLDVSLVTGNRMIDDQHRELLGRAYDMINSEQALPGYQEFMAAFTFLKDYVFYHFNAEEEFMEKQGYERLSAHRSEHDYFRKELAAIEKDASQKGATREISMRIHMLIVDRFIQHIRTTDRRMAAALQGA
jgi:hemerythrin